jgi:hypothetical protein
MRHIISQWRHLRLLMRILSRGEHGICQNLKSIDQNQKSMEDAFAESCKVTDLLVKVQFRTKDFCFLAYFRVHF